MRFLFHLMLFLPLFFLSSCISTGGDRLYYRELHVFPLNFDIQHKIVFEHHQPYLLLAAPTTNYTLHLRAYLGDSKTTLLWKQEYEMRDSMSQVVHKIKLDIASSAFALDVRILNSNQQTLFHDLYYANKATNTEEIIYLTDVAGMPLLKNYLTADQTFKISHNSDSILKFYIRYYKDPVRPAPPPYSRNTGVFNPVGNRYDEFFIVNRGKELKLTAEGLYFIQTDTLSGKGVFINYFGAEYPKMTRITDLVLATRYITKNEEYDALNNAKNQKAALDQYWLARNKKAAEAKRLISLYYNRMQEANNLFTTCKEGWKTDMGLIYSIFGKPVIVRKYPDKTIWYYSHAHGRFPVEFVFLRSAGQFILERSGNLRESWNAEILKWRVGQVEQ